MRRAFGLVADPPHVRATHLGEKENPLVWGVRAV
jgi:hypothetical protein